MRSTLLLLALTSYASSAAIAIDPQAAKNFLQILTIGSEVTVPPKFQNAVFSLLSNPIGSVVAEKVLNIFKKNEGPITNMAFNALPRVQIRDEEPMPPMIGANNLRKKIRYGPIILPPSNVTTFSTKLTGETGSHYGVETMAPFCTDCFLVGGRAYLTFRDGRRLEASDGIYDHHLSIRNIAKRTPIMGCTSGPKAPYFPGNTLGAGEELDGHEDILLKAADDKILTGQYVSKNDRILMLSELMNYQPYEQEVFYTIEAEYTEGRPEDSLETQLLLVNVGACDTVAFIPDTPQFSKSGTWVSPVDGYIVLMQGHLHDGGKNVTFKLNGTPVCDSVASYSTVAKGPHMEMQEGPPMAGGLTSVISGMTNCKQTVQIKKGDQVQMTANYDLDAHPPRRATNGANITVMAVGALSIAAPLGTLL